VGNCIGKRNLKKFFLFLLSLSLHSLIISAFTISKLIESTSPTIPWKFLDYISLFILFFSVNTFISVFLMLLQLCYLISKNKTGNENIRGIKYPRDIFDEGFSKNWKLFFNEN